MNSYLHENTFESKTKVAKTFIWFMSGLVIITICFLILSPILFKFLLNKRYYGGLVFVPWLTSFYFLQGIYLVFSSILFITKKTKYFMWISFLNILLNILLNYLLVTKIGALGAAIATVISMIIFLLLIIIISDRILPLPWRHAFKTMNWSIKSLFSVK